MSPKTVCWAGKQRGNGERLRDNGATMDRTFICAGGESRWKEFNG
jgi:hypothetical protein